MPSSTTTKLEIAKKIEKPTQKLRSASSKVRLMTAITSKTTMTAPAMSCSQKPSQPARPTSVAVRLAAAGISWVAVGGKEGPGERGGESINIDQKISIKVLARRQAAFRE
jgi:hypothetical protein